MHKYDQFIHMELSSHLSAGEKIESTAFLFNKSLGKIIALGPLSLIGEGYFFAALTRQHLFLIGTEMGIFSLKMMNKGLTKISYHEIKSLKTSGFLNQQAISFEMKDGKFFTLRLNSLATHYASGQKQFIQSLMNFHRETNA
jgi:hypothetical protein